MSPVGELYRRERERLARRWPSLGTSQVERAAALSLARAFVDLTAAELVRAMVEGSPDHDEPTAAQKTDQIGHMVDTVMSIAAAERCRDGG